MANTTSSRTQHVTVNGCLGSQTVAPSTVSSAAECMRDGKTAGKGAGGCRLIAIGGGEVGPRFVALPVGVCRRAFSLEDGWLSINVPRHATALASHHAALALTRSPALQTPRLLFCMSLLYVSVPPRPSRLPRRA
jgi:hypothetical protein